MSDTDHRLGTKAGRITFGPQNTAAAVVDTSAWRNGVTCVTLASTVQACNCRGPQPGQKLCPCMLLAESAKGRQMIEEGVVIDGVEYDLVPRPKPRSDRMAVGE